MGSRVLKQTCWSVTATLIVPEGESLVCMALSCEAMMLSCSLLFRAIIGLEKNKSLLFLTEPLSHPHPKASANLWQHSSDPRGAF